MTYFTLCRLNKSRQEEAAQAGIISSLKRIIETSSPLSSLHFPFFDLASLGKAAGHFYGSTMASQCTLGFYWILTLK